MPTNLMLGLAWVAAQAAKVVPFTPTFTKQSITYASTHHYYSSEKAYRDFGYHPPVPLSKAIDNTLAHFSQLKNPTPVNYTDGLEKKTPGLGAMLKVGLLLALIAYLFSDSGSSALGAVGLSPWLAVLVIALFAGFRARQEYCMPKFERFVPTQGLDLSGQIVLVTGGNKGIGRVTAEGYAKLKATVIIACRNENLAKDAVTEIKKSTGNANIHYVLLDLASVESVRQCAADYKKRFGPLTFLYNNAGAPLPTGTTADGFNQEMQVNHLGHFLLTNLLLQQGSLADTARVVNVSSLLHSHANLTAKTLDLNAAIGGMPGYCTVKLYNVLFSNHLNKLFKNSPVHYNKTSVAIHPGTYDTEFLDHILHPAMKKILTPFLPYFTVHHLEVVNPMLHAGLSPNLRGVGGIYLDQGNPAPASFPARDRELAAALWTASEKLLKADFSKIYS